MESSVIYDALCSSKSEIRLLKVHPSNDGVIQCNLTKCSLDTDPEYYALSYVWGDPAATKNILIDGKKFPATTNLVAALEIISETQTFDHSSTFFWIDAICINQDDIEERNTQVQMMGSIFGKAHTVLAWLGPEQNNSTEVIRIMSQIAEEIRTCANADVDILSRLAPQGLLDDLHLETSERSLLSLALPRLRGFERLLLERPFWERAWILQELVLANHVIFFCGRVGFEYLDIRTIWKWMAKLSAEAKPAAIDWGDWLSFRTDFGKVFMSPMKTSILKLEAKVISRSAGPYLAAWLTFKVACSLLATDSRDKVYSLLGLMDIGIQADYSKPPELVYLEVATTMLDRVPLDEWLWIAGTMSENRMPSLPTWIVDWHARPRSSGSFDLEHYSANSGFPELSNRTKINQQVLTISGILCDEIEFLAPFSDDFNLNSIEAFKFDLTGGLPSQEVLHTLIPPGIPRGQASLRLCLEDMDLSEKSRYVINSSYLDLTLFYLQSFQIVDPQGLAYSCQWDPEVNSKIFLGGDVTSSALERAGMVEGSREYEPIKQVGLVTRFYDHFLKARHFYTRKGYLGFGPGGLLKGDLICVLQGCRVPVILRKVDDYYHFVSICFVLGLMDGEAAQFLERGEAVVQNFDIC
ncbi:HET domain containing protein [Hyaloscypha variabilis]